MIKMKKSLAAAAVLLSAHAASHAAFVINVNEVGADVVATGQGSFLTDDLTAGSTALSSKVASYARFGLLTFAGAMQPTTDYAGLQGPASFGTGGFVFGDTFSGSPVLLRAYANQIDLPTDYVSGSALSFTGTWLNDSFSTLGMTPGTYTWTWGTGAMADSLTLNINAPVPEPESYALMLAGLGALGAVRRRQRRAR
ncbi:hypothetical protein X805_15460 [Sphaerotilus natans subsp. natans DSM 6575]|uniref:Ice-binding protein C-terminal domain-containing protein n=1 Tax=Sphaerotilus natans subsp. natans DSM 6575 TaxID=1286631 RepID=A0A059KMU9_9BURK|nr:hypothetical protein X805_15460 [Sphaerotilus natans subsp. natans DSM 6575]